MVLDPISLTFTGIKVGYKLGEWMDAAVPRTLTLANETPKNVFFALCLFTAEGSVSSGWGYVETGGVAVNTIPVPRFGSATVFLYARTRKGQSTWGGEKKYFHVCLPSYGSPLERGARFSVKDAATKSPELTMNQRVSRLGVVEGFSIAMSGNFRQRLTASG